MPADQLVVGEGRLPDGTRVTFYVSKREIDSLRDNGPQEKLELARFLLEAVAEPDAIFTGLRRPNQDESLCYAVRPTRDPDDSDDGCALAPFYGFAFLAFVRVANMGHVIFDWELREEDPDNPGHPLNWRRDFEGRAWPQP
jgi:hypothetical protein